MAKGAGLRPRAKAWDLPPDPNVHAPQLYPDIFPKNKVVKGLGQKRSFLYWRRLFETNP
jgi:hypothetical protein